MRRREQNCDLADASKRSTGLRRGRRESRMDPDVMLRGLRLDCTCPTVGRSFALGHRSHGVQVVRHGNDGQQEERQDDRSEITLPPGDGVAGMSREFAAQAGQQSQRQGQPNEIEKEFQNFTFRKYLDGLGKKSDVSPGVNLP